LDALWDGLTCHFVEQATEPVTLAAMVVGGMAYRIGRIGVLSMDVGATGWEPVRFASIVAGLGSEVTAFEITNRALISLRERAGLKPAPTGNLWNWSGAGGWREGLLSSAITFGALRGAGALAQWQNLVFQHALQTTTMVGAQNIFCGGAQPCAPSLAEQFLQAEATNLQLGAGMGLLGHPFHALERGLQLSLQERERIPFDTPSSLNLFAEGLPVFAGDPPLPDARPETEIASNTQLNHACSIGDGHGGGSGNPPSRLPTPEKARDLSVRFLPRFPSTEDPTMYSDQIVERALATPGSGPEFHERLLEAYATAKNRGTLSQRHTVDAIKKTFLYNALHSSTGTLENALLQHLIEKRIDEPDPVKRLEGLHALFRLMESGLTREKLGNLFPESSFNPEYGSSVIPLYPNSFFQRHEATFREALAAYDLRQKIQIFNFIHQEFSQDENRAERALWIFHEARDSGRYRAAQIDAALSYARRAPFGRLVLSRLLSVFIAEDVTAKLAELTQEGSADQDTLSFIREQRRSGLSPQALAEALNGTHHTAYFEDPRLALKLVSSLSFFIPYFATPATDRRAWRLHFHDTLHSFLVEQRTMNVTSMLGLADLNRLPLTESLKQHFVEGAFDIRLLQEEEFASLLAHWKDLPQDVTHLFRQQEGNRPDQILVRPMEATRPDEAMNSERRYVQLTKRLHGLVHEFEHWRHFTGNFEGIEAGQRPFDLHHISREDRLVTEIMAFLEENQWVTLNITESDWEIARRMGLNLPLFYRAMADHGYFGKTNERLAREW
jgi:hypothetical protein